MKNTPLVSVIMPVYMVEAYVGKAIESIQNQTYTNWEFFAVDDGSPDNSGAICDAYAVQDTRIQVIHKENGGAPSARNIAIDMAQGKYLYFLDSDDWVEKSMLQDMVTLAEENEAELIVAGYYIDTYYSEGEKFTQTQGIKSICYPSKEVFRKEAYQLFDENLLYTPWNKLYLAAYIKKNEIYFPETFWDDFPFNLAVVRDISNVCVTKTPYYHFIRKREESETAKYRSDMYEKREEEHAWLKELYVYWGVHDEKSEEFLARRYVERLIGCIENLTNKNCTLNTKEKKHEIKKMIKKEEARRAVKIAKPNSFYMWLMLLPIKWNVAELCYWEGKIISRVKQKNTRVFATLKANR